MASSDIFDYDVKASRSPRNLFDIGYSTLFSTPAGLLLPAYVEDVKKGDKLSLSCFNECRTRPVNTSAFMAFDERVEFYFVPYRLIWTGYDEWRLSQSFRHSSSMLQNAGGQYLLPHTSWSSVGSYMSGASGTNYELNPFNHNPAFALRMLDMLGYFAVCDHQYSTISFDNDLSDFESLESSFTNTIAALEDSSFLCNYFRLAAYQCIYMYAFRNTEYEELDPSYFNCDSLFLTTAGVPLPLNGASDPTSQLPTGLETTTPVGTLTLSKLFTPRFKNWRQDLFTSVKPASGFDAATDPTFAPTSSQGSKGAFQWPSTPAPSGLPSDHNSLRVGVASNGSNLFGMPVQQLVQGSNNGPSFLYAQNIYNLLAQDKFVRSMIYADKTMSAQCKALFGDGFEPDPHMPIYLGSFSNDVSISDIVATSAGSDGESNPETSVLGQIAGKGYGNGSSKVFEREFKEDGIVMGIHYIMPRNNYDSYRINKFNTKVSRFDYFYDHFDGLGLVPTFVGERGMYGAPVSGVNPLLTLSSVLGYSPRYYEYKTRQSEVHGSFMSAQADFDWTLTNNAFGVVSGSSKSNYKILPYLTDRIFTVASTGSLATDPFYCYFAFDVKRLSNLEKVGVPSV